MQPSLYIIFSAVSLSAFIFSAGAVAAPPGNPPGKTALDVQCDGCIDTTDIADQAVTEQKLSADLQSKLQGIPGMPLVVDGDGIAIGSLIGVDSGNSTLHYHIQTDQGYATTVSTGSGRLVSAESVGGGLWFLTEDCTGDAYVSTSQISAGWVRLLLSSPGFFSNDADTFYAPIDAIPILGDFASRSNDDGNNCSPTPATLTAYLVFPNDPVVTGVNIQAGSDDRYPMPLRIVRP